ncbi:DUF1629 domain-containing protein [Roseibium sp. HPY-6]|uniref:imm11 family protein n=1 Tax=Roseibium sp. HPY-6 TaxID=3229852 RepID=UPI0033905F99
MAWLVELSADAKRGMRIDTDFEKFNGDDELAAAASISLQLKMPLNREMKDALPKTYRMLSERKTPLEQFVAGRFGWAISQTFKDMIDDFEPQVGLNQPEKNQFVPITLLRKNREPTGVPFYYWNCLNKVDAIIEEKSDVQWRRFETYTGEPRYLLEFRTAPSIYAAPPTIYVDKSRISGRHVWWGDEHFSNRLFFSDEMKNNAESSGFKRFDYFHVIEI